MQTVSLQVVTDSELVEVYEDWLQQSERHWRLRALPFFLALMVKFKAKQRIKHSSLQTYFLSQWVLYRNHLIRTNNFRMKVKSAWHAGLCHGNGFVLSRHFYNISRALAYLWRKDLIRYSDKTCSRMLKHSLQSIPIVCSPNLWV